MRQMSRIAAVTLVVGLVATGATAAANPAAVGRSHRVFVVPPTRHADAVAEAKKLLRRSPTMSGETRVQVAPRKRLRRAPERPSFDQLVTRSRFWTSSESLQATYVALRHDTAPGMRFAGSGGGLSKDGTLSERFASYALVHPPRTIASAAMTITVIRDGKDRSDVGIYAQVVPRPRRPRNEHVPLDVQNVGLEKINLSSGSATQQRTVTGRRAQTLVRRFDALKVEPPGQSTCLEPATAIRATFNARGHTWQVQYPSCNTVSVIRDGHQLPRLDASPGFAKHLRNDLR
jgi:hypothetical protein